MEDLLNLIEERNKRETYPFVSIHASYEDLWQDVDTWQKKCEELERKVVSQQEELNNSIYDQHHHGRNDNDTNNISANSNKNEDGTTWDFNYWILIIFISAYFVAIELFYFTL